VVMGGKRTRSSAQAPRPYTVHEYRRRRPARFLLGDRPCALDASLGVELGLVHEADVHRLALEQEPAGTSAPDLVRHSCLLRAALSESVHVDLQKVEDCLPFIRRHDVVEWDDHGWRAWSGSLGAGAEAR